MGVVASNARSLPHQGVVRFRFGSEAIGLVFTRGDAAMVYDALRDRYPEKDEASLRVWVADDLTNREQASVYQRGLLEKPVVLSPGEPFHARVEATGPRSRIPANVPGVVQTEGEVDGERVAELLAAFNGGAKQWDKAEPLSQWLP